MILFVRTNFKSSTKEENDKNNLVVLKYFHNVKRIVVEALLRLTKLQNSISEKRFAKCLNQMARIFNNKQKCNP